MHGPGSIPLRVGLVGVGDITSLHFEAYRHTDRAGIVAICDVDRDLLERRRREWNIEWVTTDYRMLLDDPSIDIIEVNTPHVLHKDIVVEALAAGKHVACQKPPATTLSDCAAIITAAESAAAGGTRFRVLENFVFYPPYVMAKQLIDQGEIGVPLAIRLKLGTGLFGSRWIPLKTELWHLLESERGIGQAIFDDGYHKLSMAIHLLGEIEAVQGYIDRTFVYIDEPAQLIWRYSRCDALGSFDTAFSPNLYTASPYFPADERIEVTGTTGTIILNCCTARISDDPPLVLHKDGRRLLFDDLETDWQAGFTAAIGDFPAAILENRDTLISARRATDIVRFAYALILAAHTGREVRPADLDDAMVRSLLQPDEMSIERNGHASRS
ncbi:Gfo/Idh/MocA family oxidoreductase [bacterium]|nr:Gfo/Idh/MocA family oxidoreductase [candidate division CSSED10-310 bacterium]